MTQPLFNDDHSVTKPWWKKKRYNIPLGILILFMAIGALSDPLGEESKSETSTAAPAADKAATDKAAADKAAADKAAADKAAADKAAAEAAKPVFSKSGDKVVPLDLGEDPVALALTHSGSSNFFVTPMSATGEQGISLVNAIGAYKGTVLANANRFTKASGAIKIGADGPWTMQVIPVGALPAWDGATPMTGKGDFVFRVTPDAFDGLDAVQVAHQGESNFAVAPYGDSLSGVSVVNEMGSYLGEVPLGDDTNLVAVTADGTWTLTKTS